MLKGRIEGGEQGDVAGQKASVAATVTLRDFHTKYLSLLDIWHRSSLFWRVLNW